MKKLVPVGFLLIVPSFIFLLRPNLYWNMHDDMQLIRQLELEKCFQDGQLPCRWSPDLGFGYGYPLFNFYPQFPYLIGQIYRTLGFSFISTVKLTAITQIVVSYFAMYLLASAVFGPVGGLLSALFFTYAPYHAVNIYVRGAMNEAWSAVFFPLILYFTYHQTRQHRLSHWLGLSLSLTGLFLSHLPMTIVFLPIAVALSFYWSYPQIEKKSLRLLSSLELAIGLSSFFLLPVFFESNLVQIGSMFSNYYHYSVHFTSLRQLFISNFWGDGPSVWGQADQMSFAIGYLHWLVPLLITTGLVFKFRHFKSRLAIFTLIIVFIGFGFAFLTHQRSSFVWQLLPTLQKVQFPWRLLNPTVFFLSLSVGFLPTLLKIYLPKIRPISYLIPLIFFLLLLNLPKFYPITLGPITDAQKFSGRAWNNQITSGIYDYLPKTAPTAPKSPPAGLVDQTIPASAIIDIKNEKRGTDWFFLNFSLSQNAEVILGQLDFPNFLVFDHNKIIPHSADPELGRIKIDLDAGDHQLFVKLQNTHIRTIADIISILSWLLIFVYLIYKKWPT